MVIKGAEWGWGKIGFDISCKFSPPSSPYGSICMKCKRHFFLEEMREKKKNISNFFRRIFPQYANG